MSSTLIETVTPLTLEAFLRLPDGDITYELKDGQAIAKMSPKRIHSCLQRTLLFLLSDWGNDGVCPLQGDAYPEWAICLKRNETDWCPVPDITYISEAKLAGIELDNDACPVPPELVIEILSPGQSFEEMTQKALDYLAAGVERVWIVSDRQPRSLTIFAPDTAPMTYLDDQAIADSLFPNLKFSVNELFKKAKV